MAKKGNRIYIKFKSKSGFCYYTTKNRVNTKEKMTVKKYDPKLKKHVEFVETKIK